MTWIIEEFQDGNKDRGFLASKGTSRKIMDGKKPSLMENLVDWVLSGSFPKWEHTLATLLRRIMYHLHERLSCPLNNHQGSMHNILLE